MPESNEDNNHFTVDYAATVAADLTVTRVSATPRSPSIDERTIIKVTIRNEGLGRAGSFTVTLLIEGPEGAEPDRNPRVEELSAGAFKVLKFPWIARAGTHSFTATADSRGTIVETNESNNVLQETVTTALSDLRVTRVQFRQSESVRGRKMSRSGSGFENAGSRRFLDVSLPGYT